MRYSRRLRWWIRSLRAPRSSDSTRYSRPLAAIFFATSFLLVVAGSAAAEKRVALVMGNGAYEHVPSLENPVNDAVDISAALRSLGFEVLSAIDVGRTEMTEVIATFAERISEADVALFYYAGHAFQVDDENYLVPTDLVPSSREAVLEQTVGLNAFLEVLQTSPGIRLVFLDACRDNPLGVSTREVAGTGLARVGSSADFLISYATQPGAVAYDGDGRNGTYTEALLSHIHTPGRDLAEMMISVRRDVIAATGGQQIPWENSSLTRQFRFDSAPETASTETMLYQIAARAQDPYLMRLYLDRYPQGAHVSEAASFITSPDVASGDSSGRSLPGELTAAGDGEDLWQLAQRTRMRPLAELYVSLFPDGPHAIEARALVERLPSAAELGPGRLCERLATHPRDATANTAGVPFTRLAQSADIAVDTCRAAAAQFPEQPRYLALLARALAAANRRGEAIETYRVAADRGDLRAMVSLGLLIETGDGIERDLSAAARLYERAADLGSIDGAINLAVALFEGLGVDRDVPRALSLFRKASDAGSPIATFNLGFLAQRGDENVEEALGLFLKAAQDGEPRGYRAAAILLDEGRGGVERDPSEAATLILKGAAEDKGDILKGIRDGSDQWTPETMRAVQSRLKSADLYAGAIDGVAGPQLASALDAWRNGGYEGEVLVR